MNIDKIIEKKAREYANSQFKKGYVEGKPNFTCVDLDFAYRAGAKAMREIANKNYGKKQWNVKYTTI